MNIRGRRRQRKRRPWNIPEDLKNTLEDLRRPQETLKDFRRPWKTSEDLGRLYNASDNFEITWKIL